MKSKKPFLIICAVALTLALALPFMGVFAFAAAPEPVVLNFDSGGGNIYYRIYEVGVGGSGTQVLPGGTFSAVPGVVYFINCRPNSAGDAYYWVLFDGVKMENTSSSNPFVISFDSTGVFSSGSTITTSYPPPSTVNIYFTVEMPPDPLAPVSDGMDTMISVFGDVIDYIINTPDVAIFVAISVASCAIIPMGIILIKKLIKGY